MKAILRSINNFGCKLKQINNLKYNISPKIRSNKFKSISGNGNVTIEDAIKRNLKDYKIYGNTYQNSTSGKNFTYIEPRTSNGITSFYDKETGKISFSGTPTQQWIGIENKHAVSIPAGTYTLSLKESKSFRIIVRYYTDDTNYEEISISANSKSSTKTFSNNIITTQIWIQLVVGTTYNEEFYMQLEKGSTATEFEPYTGGQPSPNPDYPQEIISCGDRAKNLFDKANATYKNGYYKNDNGVEQTTNQSGYLTSYVSVKPNTTYTIQGSLKQTNQSTHIYALYYYDINKNWIYRTTTTDNPPYTFTTPNDCYFIQFQYRQDAYDEDTIQIEEGSTATSYDPYYDGYKIPVNVRSDNLYVNGNQTYQFTTSNSTWRFLDGSTGASGSNVKNTIYKAPVIQGETYNFSVNINASSKIITTLIYDDETPIKRLDGSNIKYNETFTATKTGYVILRYYIGANISVSTSNIMLVKNSTVPSKYIPYYNETTNIYLDEPLRKTKDGNYVDYIDFINQKVYRQLGESQINNYSSFNHNGTRDEYMMFITPTINNLKLNIPNIGTSNIMFCNYISQLRGTTPSQKIRINIPHEYLGTTSSSTAQEAKQALINLMSGKTMIFTYPLETPTEENIELPNINLIEGKNIITIGTEVQGVFETEYYSKEIIDISNYKYNLRKVED